MVSEKGITVETFTDEEIVIALGGNPNVGKSNIFNNLTGLNQHTGNWPGKTVTNARGKYCHNNKDFNLVDLPGTYSFRKAIRATKSSCSWNICYYWERTK